MDTISILIAVPGVDKRVELKKTLFEDKDMEVVGEVEDPEECLKEVRDKQPALLLLSLELAGSDELEGLVEDIINEAPQTEIIVLAPDEERESEAHGLIRQGVYDFLVEPVEAGELVDTVRDTFEVTRRRQEKLQEVISGRAPGQSERSGRIISVFSTKGGVGRSLIAVNLACGLRRLTSKRVALVDLDLQFGDDAVLLDIKPTNMISTLARDCKEVESVDYDLLDSYMHTHEQTGVDLLPSPGQPHEAEFVSEEDVQKILKALRRHYHYIIIDTSSHVSEPVISAIESSDLVLLLLTLELPTIKNGKLMLDLMDELGLSRNLVRIVMNRDVPNSEIQLEEVEEALGEDIIGSLPSAGQIVMPSIDEGVPVLVSHPESQFSNSLMGLLRKIVTDEFELEEEIVPEQSPEAEGAGVDINLPDPLHRLGAGLIDYGITAASWAIFILLGVITSVFISGVPGVVLGVIIGLLGGFIPLGYFTYFHADGQPPGKRLLNIKLIRPGEETVSPEVALGRTLASFVSALPLGLGFWWAFWDSAGQTWHDKIAGTYVVPVEEE
ncbi:MAG: RDD family protein [bacterium]